MRLKTEPVSQLASSERTWQASEDLGKKKETKRAPLSVSAGFLTLLFAVL